MNIALELARAALGALLSTSGPLVARNGAPARSDRGDALDTQLQAMLRLHGWLPQAGHQDRDVARRRREMRLSALLAAGPVPGGLTVTTCEVAGLPARRYTPEGDTDGAGLVYLHGGGFVGGDLDSHHAVCATLADRARCVVVSVAYRLSPEHRFPAALDDAWSAWLATRADAATHGLDPARTALGGDSAGGNLTASTVLLLRDAALPLPCAQLLLYPAVDMTLSQPSHRTLADGYYLDAATIDWFLRQYLRTADDARDPRASPLLADDLSGLPPAHVVTAGFDPLRDEGELYAARLADAGVQVTHQREPGLIHGFANMAGASSAAHEALLRAGDGLAALLRGQVGG